VISKQSVSVPKDDILESNIQISTESNLDNSEKKKVASLVHTLKAQQNKNF